MWNELGLVLSLNTIIEGGEVAAETLEQAKKTLLIITPTGAAPNLAAPSTPARTPMGDVGNTRAAVAAAAPSAATSTTSFFKPAATQDARNVILQVNGLDDLRSRKLLENQLLTVKGVISFTMDMSMSRVTVRIRSSVTAQTLCEAIADSQTLTAQEVVKDHDGREVVLSFGPSPGSSSRPQYIDEEEEEEEVDDGKAVVALGGAFGVSSWLGNAVSYVSGNLYW
jgi:armadillo repeat-containing protein 1